MSTIVGTQEIIEFQNLSSAEFFVHVSIFTLLNFVSNLWKCLSSFFCESWNVSEESSRLFFCVHTTTPNHSFLFWPWATNKLLCPKKKKRNSEDDTTVRCFTSSERVTERQIPVFRTFLNDAKHRFNNITNKLALDYELFWYHFFRIHFSLSVLCFSSSWRKTEANHHEF